VHLHCVDRAKRLCLLRIRLRRSGFTRCAPRASKTGHKAQYGRLFVFTFPSVIRPRRKTIESRRGFAALHGSGYDVVDGRQSQSAHKCLLIGEDRTRPVAAAPCCAYATASFQVRLKRFTGTVGPFISADYRSRCVTDTIDPTSFRAADDARRVSSFKGMRGSKNANENPSADGHIQGLSKGGL